MQSARLQTHSGVCRSILAGVRCVELFGSHALLLLPRCRTAHRRDAGVVRVRMHARAGARQTLWSCRPLVVDPTAPCVVYCRPQQAAYARQVRMSCVILWLGRRDV
jgi:hypothetical protein